MGAQYNPLLFYPLNFQFRQTPQNIPGPINSPVQILQLLKIEEHANETELEKPEKGELKQTKNRIRNSKKNKIKLE